MKTIGIISNNIKQKALEIARSAYDYFTEKGIKVLLPAEDKLSAKYSLPCVTNDIFSSQSEAIISVGGDGTFLRASKYSFNNEVPVLGINVGTLGFLTEVDTANIREAMDGIINGTYHLEKRMLLEGKLYKGKSVKDTISSDLALNEFAITRSMNEKVIKMEIIVNDISIKTIVADGIIVATPTGSTAYSLSAGGPIVEPGAETIIVTPICPHTLFNRSIILASDRLLEIKICSGNKRDILSIDGKSVPLEEMSEYTLKVTRSEKNLNLISFNPNAFFKVFKEKFIEGI